MAESALSAVNAQQIIDLLGNYPESGSGSDFSPPGGPIVAGHPLYSSIGELVGKLPLESEYRRAWISLKTRSRRVSEWDGDDEPIGSSTEVRDLKKSIKRFKKILKKVIQPTPKTDPPRKQSRRGRKLVTDLKEDSRLAAAWATQKYKTHAELASVEKMKVIDLKRALDRARQRRNK
jgi:hypothetical protein